MIIFYKKRDESNQFDHSDVMVECEEELCLGDIVDCFRDFLLAAGFGIKSVERIQFIEDE